MELESNLRKEFPFSEEVIFFDHAGVSPITKRAKERMSQFLQRISDPGGINSAEFSEEVEKSREVCAKLINSEQKEISFVRSTSFGISLVASGLKYKTGDNIVTYYQEFPANIYPWLNLIKKGVEIRMVKDREGEIRIEDISQLINSRTRLIAISSVQFTNGFRINLNDLCQLANKRGIFLIVDAIQSLGIIPFDVKETPVDFLCADGHKWLMAPEGIGFLYISSRLLNQLDLHILGWNSVVDAQNYLNYRLNLKPDARRFEEGSYNTLSIIGLGASISLLLEAGVDRLFQKVLELNTILAEELAKTGAKILSPMGDGQRSGILTIRPNNREPEEVARLLREKGAMCSVRGGGIRLSPHGYQGVAEVEKVLRIWKEALG